MRQLDELRFLRPLAPDAHPFRTIVGRAARITTIYVAIGVSGSFLVAITCLIAVAGEKTIFFALLFVTIGLVLAYLGVTRKTISFGRTPNPETALVEEMVPQYRLDALVPLLLLYTSQRLDRQYRQLKKKPHDYVYQAFDHVLSDAVEQRSSSLMPALCNTIDALIASDATMSREG